jgi:hypothetical protein
MYNADTLLQFKFESMNMIGRIQAGIQHVTNQKQKLQPSYFDTVYLI